MRMIDADALYDKAESAYKNAPWQIRSTCRWFVDSIADAPTVDAVEVVRCKDCKYSTEIGKWGCYCRKDDAPWFNDTFEVYMNLDDFCSYGEKRVSNG